jgi:hypothetical protein
MWRREVMGEEREHGDRLPFLRKRGNNGNR